MSTADAIEPGAMRARLAALHTLPPLPATVELLLDHAAESNPAAVVAACARRDPALFARLLRGRDHLPAIDAASAGTPVSALLREAAPTLAARILAASAETPARDAFAALVWPRALRTAALAEAFASAPGMPDGIAERAHAVGLLLDLGAAALAFLDPDGYAAILHEHGQDRTALLAAERDRYGMTHSLAGRILADAWDLPAEVRRHLWLQYQPRPAPSQSEAERSIALALHWARRFAWGDAEAGFEQAAKSLASTAEIVQALFESACDRAAALEQAAPAEASPAFRARLAAFLASPIPEAPPESLAWAEEALMAGEESTAHTPDLPAPIQVDAAAALARALRLPIHEVAAQANALLTAPGAPNPRILSAIYNNGQQAERILQDFLTHTQPEPIKPEPQLLNFFLQRFFQSIEDRLRRGGIRIAFDLAEGLPRVALDRTAFEHVLLNIAANAEQAMGHLGGVLTIGTESAGPDGVIVTISDTGSGLDPAMATRAFEPFVAGPAGGDGPGLGLTVARAIVESLGGRISLAPGIQGGAACAIALPAAIASNPAARAKPERPILRVVDVQTPAEPAAMPAEPTAQPELDPARLLVADPDFELGELLHELLGRRGFEVVYHRDPAQALAEAASAPFGQLLVDASLHAPDGRILAEALRDALPGARLILTIAPGAMHDAAGPSDARLEKPFPVRALLAALHPATSPLEK